MILDAGASVFNPSSPGARAISDLFVDVLWLCGVILLLVMVLVFLCVVWFRKKPGQGEPPRRKEWVWMEVAWTVIPFLILVWIFFLTIRSMRKSDAIPNRDPDLIVTGHQWWWEAQYPKSGAVTANEIHIPAAKNLLVRLESADVIHDFWVPALGRKMDMIPGHPNSILLEADKAGTYQGACAEYCGQEHAWMRFLVIAEPEEVFEAWQKHQLEPAPVPRTESQKRGAQLFEKFACVKCHSINGTSATGKVAPNLTHVAQRQTLGAGVLKNNATNLALWLKNPQAVKPGCAMPNAHLNDFQVKALVDYLETLK